MLGAPTDEQFGCNGNEVVVYDLGTKTTQVLLPKSAEQYVWRISWLDEHRVLATIQGDGAVNGGLQWYSQRGTSAQASQVFSRFKAEIYRKEYLPFSVL